MPHWMARVRWLEIMAKWARIGQQQALFRLLVKFEQLWRLGNLLFVLELPKRQSDLLTHCDDSKTKLLCTSCWTALGIVTHIQHWLPSRISRQMFQWILSRLRSANALEVRLVSVPSAPIRKSVAQVFWLGQQLGYWHPCTFSSQLQCGISLESELWRPARDTQQSKSSSHHLSERNACF